MSQVKLALQPPPNVDFVIGYPGIPPGARDRPQAAVKGAVEVRVGPQGVKAKWVRVELKKIETLPGGGQANSYYDHVGPSPIHLWQSSEEYKMLLSQDFPFYIRIPESIPPSIALEKGAGIRYELVATVCTLGKKGFFRRRKSLVTSTSTIITIDKHELHSTWPVYSQPDSRRASHDGVHLIIERSHTCFGPGDRVSVMAIVKSDSVHTVILRGFEFALVETTIFRPGPYASGKKGGPDKKANIIGDQKVPVNATLYGGAQHKAELGCLIPNTHTTTSLNAARHIDITYSIVVMAWLATGQVIKLELPVIVSNWPRSVSLEAVRRIGNAPSLSLQQHASAVPVVPATTRPTHVPTSSIISDDLYTTTKSDGTHGVASSIKYNTAPTGYKSDLKSTLQADEMGYGKPTALPAATIDHVGYASPGSVHARPSVRSQAETPSRLEATPRPTTASTTGGRRRGSGAANTRSFLVTNMSEEDAAEARRDAEVTSQQSGRGPPSTPPSSGRPSHAAWPTSEDEKRELYEKARADVERVQGTAALAHTPSIGKTSPSPQSSPKPNSSSGRMDQWVSAEQEKIRLFNHAKAIAARMQAGAYSPPHSRSNSEINGSSSQSKPVSNSQSTPTVSPGAALYQQAISSMNNALESNKGSRQPPASPSTGRSIPYYPSAEQEKAALKRYEQAKLAVDRIQTAQYASNDDISSSAPISYDALYPQTTGQSQSYTPVNNARGDMPPPFESSGSQQPAYINEKERLRRAYENQDAAASSQQQQISPMPYSPSPVQPYSPPPSLANNALSEKERLRRRYEEQDAAAMGQVLPPQPPPPRIANGARSSPRSPPMPPGGSGGGGFRPLTAAEEKAQLKAKYEAEEQQGNGSLRQNSSTGHDSYTPAVPPPPPLAPRPPAEYIKETQEEDARVQSYIGNGLVMDDPHPYSASSLNGNGRQIALDMRPFTPFSVGLHGTEEGSPSLPGPPKFYSKNSF